MTSPWFWEQRSEIKLLGELVVFGGFGGDSFLPLLFLVTVSSPWRSLAYRCITLNLWLGCTGGSSCVSPHLIFSLHMCLYPNFLLLTRTRVTGLGSTLNPYDFILTSGRHEFKGYPSTDSVKSRNPPELLVWVEQAASGPTLQPSEDGKKGWRGGVDLLLWAQNHHM